MKEKKQQALHITFHNPNSEEETVKHLTKLIADGMARQASATASSTQSLTKKQPKRRIAV
jgi:hypothetical protein